MRAGKVAEIESLRARLELEPSFCCEFAEEGVGIEFVVTTLRESGSFRVRTAAAWVIFFRGADDI